MDGKYSLYVTFLIMMILKDSMLIINFMCLFIICFNFYSTCACGKWICTSKLCGSYRQDSTSSSNDKKDDEENQYEDMDNQID